MRFSSIVDARQRHALGAGGDDDVLGLQRLLLAVGAGRPRPCRAPTMRPVPLSHVDLVLPEQELDALDVAVDDLVLAGQHRARSSFTLSTLMPWSAKPWPASAKSSLTMQQRLRRDAADVEAGAAEGGALLDAGDLHAELRGADGADIAAGAGADDDDIEDSAIGSGLSRNRLDDGNRHGRSRDPSSKAARGSSTPSFTRTRNVTASCRRRCGDRRTARDTSSAGSRSCRRPPSAAPGSCACPECPIAAGSGSAWTSASRRRRRW